MRCIRNDGISDTPKPLIYLCLRDTEYSQCIIWDNTHQPIHRYIRHRQSNCFSHRHERQLKEHSPEQQQNCPLRHHRFFLQSPAVLLIFVSTDLGLLKQLQASELLILLAAQYEILSESLVPCIYGKLKNANRNRECLYTS